MNRSSVHVLLIAAALSFYACNSSTQENSANAEQTDVKSKEERLAEIAEIEDQVKQSKGKNAQSHAQRLEVHLEAFATDFRADSLAPEMLFKAGNVCIGLNDFEKSIAYFDRIAKHYPEYIKRPEVIYMAGFVYDYHLSQYGKAKDYYERVIAEYPNHIFADDAKKAIEVLGMSDEELMERFKKANESKEKTS